MRRPIKNPRFLLVFPPLQYAAGEMVRPDGTLGLAYLDAALTAAGFESHILDMSIGTPHDRLENTFYRQVSIAEGMVRIGLTAERILEEVEHFDVIAVTSIFTQQTSRCFEVSQLIKQAYPEKLLIAGGVNARSLREHFFDHGYDVVFLSEAEKPIVRFAQALRSGTTFAEIPGIAFREPGGTVVTAPAPVTMNLDEYSLPSWHKLPNERYWEISRIWGGREGWINGEAQPRYAAIFTSRGCPFRCTYCHVSTERGAGEAGDIGTLRLHSLERVEHELDTLRSLGIDYLYINDDSFLAKKERVFAILETLRRYRFTLADVNGVNIIHLFTRHNGRLVVDEELLAALYAAGFRKVSLPFESGTQRLIDQYSSGKWDLQQCDVVDLVRKINHAGLVADGNFMIGYPDETLEELSETFVLARRLMDAGLIGCQFFMVQPFPGTQLFAESLANGQLAPTWHWDELGWSKGSPFTHPRIDKQVLKYSWQLVWKLLNRDTRAREFLEQLP